MKKILLIILLFSLSQSQLLINEIDYDQPGTDSTEYLELIGEAGTYNNVVVSLIIHLTIRFPWEISLSQMKLTDLVFM